MQRQIAILSAFFLFAQPQSSFGSPIGMWKAFDGAVIQIKPCGRNLCGFIAKTYPLMRDPLTGKADYSDRNNEDPEKRKRSRIGIEVLISMQPTGPSTWSGQLYNDRSGQSHQGKLIEVSQDEIKIEGCWFVFCGGEILTRTNLRRMRDVASDTKRTPQK